MLLPEIDALFFVQKPYLKTNYIESNFEEDSDMKSQLRKKNHQTQIVLANQFQKYMLIKTITIEVYVKTPHMLT